MTAVIAAGVGLLEEPFESVERIAVLRGGGLGDFVGALPAIDALAAAYPGAAVTLLGLPTHAALLAGRPGSPISDVEVLPAAPGVRDGESDPAEVEAFLARMRERRFDLAVQLHGGGRNSNPFLLRMAARHTVGTRTPDAPALERNLPYRYYQHEVHRWLEVAGLAGAAPVRLEPSLRASDEERAAAEALLPPTARRVVLHPSATDPRRRWPADRFGAVAAALAERGVGVAVIGDAEETALAEEVVQAAQQALPKDGRDLVHSLAGRLTLGQLPGVLAVADVVLANDSGPRHIAAALGTPTVGIFWFGNALNVAPFGRGRHRVLLAWTTRCPVCGADATQVGWTAERCTHNPSFVADVEVPAVLDEVLDLLG
jgi:ADP-heptose:LPS heptosyltransferase